MKKLIISSLLGLGISSGAIAEDVGFDLDLSANLGLSSDYIWRGVSQTGGHPAISGGLDLSHENTGIYLGNWNSNVTGGTEVDLYGGVSNEIGDSGVSYDVGAIGYIYPGQDGLDFYEVYGGLGVDIGAVSPAATYYYDPDNENSYLDTSVDVSLPAEFTLTGHYGRTFVKGDGDINDYLVGVSRSFIGLDFGLNYTDSGADRDRLVFSVGKTF